MKKLHILLVMISLTVLSSCVQKQEKSTTNKSFIYIEGTKLMLNGSEIYLNGANTPWDNWNDFGGDNDSAFYNKTFWEEEMVRLAQYGMNSTRIWISCDGAGQPFVAEDGTVHPPTEKFWNDLDHMLYHAEKNGIYIMPTMMSFDHFDDKKLNHMGWRTMIQSKEKIQTFIDNYLVPFVERYKDNPYVFSIDLCNEPEWIHENEQYGNIAWEHLQQYAGMCAAAIHRTGSPVLVSIGSVGVKWGSDAYEFGNLWSDKNLQKQTNGDKLAFMDFWQVHYYSWMHELFSSPFEKSPEDYILNDRPVVIGETPGRPEYYGFEITTEEMFERPYLLGYAGVMVWTSNNAGVGDFGSLETFGHASRAFADKYPQLIHAKK